MKRTLAVLLALTMAITCFAGCASNATSAAPSTAASAAPTTAAAAATTAPADASATPAAAATTKTPSGKEYFQGKDLSNTTIDFWNYITGSDNPCLTQWVTKFNKENPYGIKIKQDSQAGDVLLQKLPVALAAGTGPQLTLCGLSVPAYADQGLIQPLDDIFKYTDLKKTDFIDGLLDITSYNGKLYGVPFYIGVTFMFWNKDLYRKAGLDPEKGPKTWQELYDNSVAINKLGNGTHGLAFPYGLTYSVYDEMASFGGKIITVDPTTNLYKNEIYSDANKKALTFWQRFYKEGLNPKDASDDMFYGKVVGTILSGPWAGKKAHDEYGIDVGYGLAPGADAGTYYYCACMNMNITNNAKTPEQVMAGYVWMAYWNRTEPCVDFSTQNSTPVYLKAAAQDPKITGNPILKAMSDFTGRTAWNWVPVGFTAADDVNKQLGSMLEAIALGADVDASLKKCSDSVDKILVDVNAKRAKK